MGKSENRDRTKRLKSNPYNQLAWDQWFRAVYPRVYYVMFRKTSGDVSSAQDMVSGAIERFIRYKALEKVRDDKESVAYLISTGTRLLFDAAKIEARERSSGIEPPLSDQLDVDEEIDLELMIKDLDADDQALTRLLMEGKTVGEIADSLEIRYSAAGARISRLRSKLKESAKRV